MARVSFKTKSGERVSFKAGTMGKKKKGGMSQAKRKAASRRAKGRARYKTGPRKGQFK